MGAQGAAKAVAGRARQTQRRAGSDQGSREAATKAGLERSTSRAGREHTLGNKHGGGGKALAGAALLEFCER